MRKRSNVIILFGVAFFFIGGVIVFLLLNDDDSGGPSASGSSSTGNVTVLSAAKDIPANTLASDAISQELLTTAVVPAGTQPTGAITSAIDLENKIFVVAVPKGNTISASQLAVRSLSNISVPNGFDGVAVSVTFTNGGAGYIAPGDRVNVFGVFGPADDDAAGLSTTTANGRTAVPRTELLLTNVRVLDVNVQSGASFQTDDDRNTGVARAAGQQSLTYLLALRPADVERIVQASVFADLYFSLVSEENGPAGDTPGVDGGNIVAPVSAGSAASNGE